MRNAYLNNVTMDPSGFVLLSDYVPHIIDEPYPDTTSSFRYLLII